MTADDPDIAAFLARGGRITRCPPAYAAPSLHAAAPLPDTAAAHAARGPDPVAPGTWKRRRPSTARERSVSAGVTSAARRART